ncbi:MAG TPA: contractile injection system tape measure protein [Flavitalea sp.]|nr:contractile injection system tape measure protein [Flavitalea sp.]
MRHVIRKQVLDINLNKTQDAFRVQNDLSRFYWNQIVPTLERVFNEISVEDEIIQIDRLELDLGKLWLESIGSGKPDNDLFERLYKQIKEAVAATKKTSAQGKVKSIAAQWLYYMERGWLDWNTLEIDHEWNRKVLEALATDYASITALRHLVQKDSRVRARIAMRHDEVFLLQLIEVLTAQKQDDIAHVIRELISLFTSLNIQIPADLSSPGTIEKLLWSQAIFLAAIQGSKMNARQLAAEILNLYIGEKTNPAWKRILSATEATVPYLSKFYLSEKYRIAFDDEEKHLTGRSLEKMTQEQKNIQHEIEKELLEDGIFLNNAGLVLLHPFLSTLLTRIGLIESGSFREPLAHQKALHVLHYLALGRQATEEHELLMPKILLAYPLEDLVLLDVHLTDAEKEEADSLLETVIARWQILHNTSKAGLREGFLQRRGKYFLKNDNFYLQVEQGSIDMLLDHLPWNLSIIKLPWMNQMLRVEWR